MARTIILWLLLGAGGIHGALRWPIDGARRISGTFGEYRGPRFHAGIDISTSWRTGLPVRAADSGYIESARYQGRGIGFALVLRHHDGRRSLYGHLDRFAPSLMKHAPLRQQRRHIRDRRDFRVRFREDALPVKRGQLIAYSGQTGIGPPHLQFELHDRDGVLLNPLAPGQLPYRDTRRPVIRWLVLVPLAPHAAVNGMTQPVFLAVTLAQPSLGIYELTHGAPLVSGPVGMLLCAHDRHRGRNRLALYRVESYIDRRRVWSRRFDRLPPSEKYTAGLTYHYHYSTISRYTYYVYNRRDRTGTLPTVRRERTRSVRINIFDAAANRAGLRFRVMCLPPESSPRERRPNTGPKRPVRLTSTDGRFSITVPSGHALHPARLRIHRQPPYTLPQKGLTVIGRPYTVRPTHAAFGKRLIVRLTPPPGTERDGLCLMGVLGHRGPFRKYRRHVRYLSLHRSRRGDGITARLWRTGTFVLVRDRAAPSLRLAKRVVTSGKPLAIKYRDHGSGVDPATARLTIDGKPSACYADYDRRLLRVPTYQQDAYRPGRHRLRLTLSDRAGNRARLNAKYRVTP